MSLPSRLYRYVPTSTPEQLSRLVGWLSARTLYLRSPRHFNDAHEGIIRLEMPEDAESLSRLADNEGFLRNYGWRLSQPKAERVALLRLLRPAVQRHLDTVETRQYLDEIVACCFSESRDVSLMWAHYAGAYDGVCVEFAPELCSLLRNNIEQVNYVSAPPTVLMGSDPHETGRLLATSKSLAWSYEKEWRLVLPAPERSEAFAQSALTGLVFGVHTSRATRSSVIAALEDLVSMVTLHIAAPSGYGVSMIATDAGTVV